jgi:hypothetical protein
LASLVTGLALALAHPFGFLATHDLALQG